jgi:hypothetical protein
VPLAPDSVRCEEGSFMTTAAVGMPNAGRTGVPEPGQLVQVRGQQWVVSDVIRSRQPVDELAASRLPGQTLEDGSRVNVLFVG